ncbi:VOC family protein [Roseobacter sp. HKCCA0434]|uniref:VOC family protein n=1 Tax=Roseobacter sp. HKCCA0434 TaxID=3079297 RepID=UPI002905BCE3|nr:VOC family protein [Roseobacter sp. HKCCA0434]
MTETTTGTCFWYDGTAEEAARLYTSIIPRSSITAVIRNPMAWPGGAAGDVVLVEFELAGTRYQALNGGPDQPFNETASVTVSCPDQAEVDRIWDALIDAGGEAMMCGWLKDRYGLRWQIVPQAMERMLRSGDSDGIGRAMAAMGEMVKLDGPALERAFEG